MSHPNKPPTAIEDPASNIQHRSLPSTMPEPQSPPFTAIRVIDATTNVGGPMLGWLLAEQGADVIKVEPPSGDPLRGSPAFHVLNRGKRSVTIDLWSPVPITGESLGVSQLWRLLGQSDVFLYDWKPGVAEGLGISPDALRERTPSLIAAYLPAYGSRGPYAHLPPDEALVQALAAVCDGQYRYDPPPVLLNHNVGGYSQGLLGAIAVASSLYARLRSHSGVGDRCEVSQIAGTFAMEASAWVNAETVVRMAGTLSPHGPLSTYRLVQASDGEWLFCGALTAAFWTKLAVAIGLEDCLADERFKHAPMGIADIDDRRELGQRVSDAFKTKPRDEWLRLLEEADVPRAPVASRMDWANDPHVIENNLVVEIDDPVLGKTRQPALPLTMRNHPGRIGAAAPALGAHNEEIFGDPSFRADDPSFRAAAWNLRETGRKRQDQPTVADQDQSDLRRPTSDLQQGAPLAGVTVIDLSGFIAGASASMMLADLGANVLKIEPPSGDGWRSSGLAFLGSNRGKRSVVIDLKRPEGIELLLDLIDKADVLHDNFRHGVMERMGITWETLSARNPRLIWSSVTGYGPTGPLAHLPGFDPMMQSRGGIMRAQGGPAEPVYLQMPVCDFGTALTSAFGIIAALVAREPNHPGDPSAGMGDRVETSLARSAFTVQAGGMIFYDGAGPRRLPDREGGRDLAGHHALYGIYPASDGHLMVACTTDAQAAAFASAIGIEIPEPLEQPTDGDTAASIEAALKTRTVAEWMAAFLPVKLPVAPCTRVIDMFEDEHLAANNLWWDAEHPRWGNVRQTGALIQWDRMSMSLDHRAPTLGEHTEECLAELGVPDAKVRDLLESGVLMQF